MLITMGLQVVTRGPIMAIWAIGKIFRSFRILALGRTCGSDCQCFDDDRFDDASLSKTVLDSKSH